MTATARASLEARVKLVIAVAAAVLAFGAADRASAQPKPQPPRAPERPGSFEVTALALVFAPSSLGSSNATLTSNDAAGSPYTLFATTGQLRAAVGLEARVGYELTQALAVEGGVTYSRQGVDFTVANDAEGAPGFTAPGETLSQFFVEASLVAHLTRYRFAGGRARPFVEAGAGYLRELHGQTSVASTYAFAASGKVLHAGGGVKYFFSPRPSGRIKAYGLRFDARVYVRSGGFTFGGSNPKTFAAGGGLLVAF